MPFNIEKCDIHQVGTKNKYDYEMCSVKIENVQRVKDVGVEVVSNLKFSQQCNGAENRTNKMLDFTKRNFSFNKDVILSF